jgi:hypothetical protein
LPPSAPKQTDPALNRPKPARFAGGFGAATFAEIFVNGICQRQLAQTRRRMLKRAGPRDKFN